MKRRVDLILKMLEDKGEEKESVKNKENDPSMLNTEETVDGNTKKRKRSDSGEPHNYNTVKEKSHNDKENDSSSPNLYEAIEQEKAIINQAELEVEKKPENESTFEDQTIPKKSRSRSSSTSSSSSCSSSSSSSSSSSGSSSSRTSKKRSDKQNTSLLSTSTKPSTSKLNSTPSSLSPKPSTSKQHATTPISSNPKKSLNYRISPINTDESDVDLSDSDPTFRINNGAGNNGSSSESVSRSADAETNDRKKKTRKRLRNPSNWKQNVAKQLRNTGKAYRSLSKTKKNVSARSMKEGCNCKKKCSEKISDTDRLTLFNSFWKLSNLELQRAYIRSCMFEIKPKYKYTNAEKPRFPNNALYFTLDSNKIRVCKKFFINTLDISDRQLRTVKSKTNSQGFVEQDRRGKHSNRKLVDSTLLQDIRNHINSIPKIESHYLRATTDKEYISDSKTVKDLCNDFNQKQKENNRSQCDYWLYINTFNKEFNIGFFQPRKDRCDICLSYELASESTRTGLKSNYENHLEEKKLCRQEKKSDRANINNTNICAIFDLQAVMLCPSPSYFYYSSKINCLDFTITELKATQQEDNKAYGDVFCYFWDETQGNRGSNEIGSCLFDYLKTLSSKHTDNSLNIIFYSDNCTGQNKNKVIASLYSFAVIHFKNIQSITHKYLIKGHTHNEADNVHSLIEKEIKKNEKAGPIYTPYQYVTIIKSARKSGKPFTVREMNHNCFYNLKQLQEQWAYNFNEDTEKKKLIWNDIKVMKFLKEEPYLLKYKTSYSQAAFQTINMRNKRKKMVPYEEITLQNLYEEPIVLKENKRKDLKNLVKQNQIPHYYSSFYDSL